MKNPCSDWLMMMLLSSVSLFPGRSLEVVIAFLTQVSFSMEMERLELLRLSVVDCKSVGLLQCNPYLKQEIKLRHSGGDCMPRPWQTSKMF